MQEVNETLLKKRESSFSKFISGSNKVYIVLFAIIVISIILAFSYFANWTNIMNVMVNVSLFGGIAAIGMTFVIISGGIDLSVAAVMAFAANMLCNFYNLSKAGKFPEVLGIVYTLLIVFGVAAVIGAANGAMITYLKLEPFIVTLGTMTLLYGANLWTTQGRTINGVFNAFNYIGTGSFTWLKDGKFFFGPVQGEVAKQVLFKIPLIPIIFIVFCVVFFILLKRSVYGRHIFAVGGNAEAARLSGIKVDQNRLVTYILCSLLAAVNGLLLASWTKAYAPNMTYGFELDIIAAVIIGGTVLSGGLGSIGGTIAGLIILQILYNMINLGVDLSTYGISWSWAPATYVRQFIKGIIIIGAVILQGRSSKK